MQSRAYRRAVRENLQIKRRVYFWDRLAFDREHYMKTRALHRLRVAQLPFAPERVDTACPCSLCGNPRRHLDQITLAELKADINFQQQLEELAERPEFVPAPSEFEDNFGYWNDDPNRSEDNFLEWKNNHVHTDSFRLLDIFRICSNLARL